MGQSPGAKTSFLASQTPASPVPSHLLAAPSLSALSLPLLSATRPLPYTSHSLSLGYPVPTMALSIILMRRHPNVYLQPDCPHERQIRTAPTTPRGLLIEDSTATCPIENLFSFPSSKITDPYAFAANIPISVNSTRTCQSTAGAAVRPGSTRKPSSQVPTCTCTALWARASSKSGPWGPHLP